MSLWLPKFLKCNQLDQDTPRKIDQIDLITTEGSPFEFVNRNMQVFKEQGCGGYRKKEGMRWKQVKCKKVDGT